MSCVGVFRKVDRDGESKLVFTLTQTTASSSSSSSEALATVSGEEESLFLCPRARLEFQRFKLKLDHDDDKLYPLDSSPLFSRTSGSCQEGESLLDCDMDYICKLPLVPFDKNHKFTCGACHRARQSTCIGYYGCLKCQEFFHKECAESPLEIKHPSHPFHSLKLYMRGNFLSAMFYRCTTCKLKMSPTEAMKPIPFVIDHQKSHPHPLTFFPTQASLVCHICGQIKEFDPTYICIQCVFVIHKGCIGFPHVIRISRHHHRLSFTPSLPPGKLPCRVCHQEVDNNYGAYSCSKCACFVHKKCALNERVWDGKDLDGVPEEDDMIDDCEPFERIADGIILHPSHNHYLRSDEISIIYDENKFCEGCGLPIFEGKYYSCMECDFILHESCAHAPRMIRHPFHPSPLTLDFTPKEASGFCKGLFTCSVCYRKATGFAYECHQSRYIIFRIDLKCAFITEPFEYEGHKDPLFLDLDAKENVRCQICRYNYPSEKLRCIECDYVICVYCATLPYKARYKHDSHILTICYEKEENDQLGWCEICEGKIVVQREADYDFIFRIAEVEFSYKCNEYCRTTIHVKCLLGGHGDIYMKPRKARNGCMYSIRSLFESDGPLWVEFQIILNNSLSRPICGVCHARCPFPIFYKFSVLRFCSMDCIGKHLSSLTWG